MNKIQETIFDFEQAAEALVSKAEAAFEQGKREGEVTVMQLFRDDLCRRWRDNPEVSGDVDLVLKFLDQWYPEIKQQSVPKAKG